MLVLLGAEYPELVEKSAHRRHSDRQKRRLWRCCWTQVSLTTVELEQLRWQLLGEVALPSA